ncbi:recombinase RecT [Streptococcus anginosus]|uniref:recombinase RecT n=1 Tax=Streptococcus anginosus TaxID=1328 RepID=UPI0021537E0B|nr:recombinase RecT [Streptococcus anginosus]MCW0945114.1 recombinase RecT [Streptococcus anginosus]MCW1082747.1 recombinase RecT [Streptococcus anginosus]MDI7734873.1 recombinase RecT [Streptococcus anginosus]MED5922918.1 recombinase RecT [Streptococcus anginosus]MED5953606.1 recombinase RecT [Streptococcus anginosus]
MPKRKGNKMTNNLTKVSHKDFFNAPAVKAKFQEVLKGKENEFVASLLSVVTNNNLLMKASNESIMTAAMKAAVLNLPIEPSLGQAYIVPYGREAQFQLGYKGLIQLAQRSGKYKSINSGVVYKAQFISYNPLFEELEIDFTQPQDEVIGYFAAFKLLNGFEKVTYWTKEQAYAHGKRFSKSFNNGPWKSDFDAMAQKTLLKQIISKYGPLSIEMEQAIVADNETENEKAAPIDVTPQETESLDDVLGNPTVSESESVENPQETAEEPKNKVAVSKTETTTPKVNEETGEILDGEQGELFKELEDLM